MTELFRHPLRVEFKDTDAAGIAHFSNFFTWMEQAEHAALRHVGLSVLDRRTEGTISWPRVASNCDFKSPVRFEDQLEVVVGIRKLGTRSVTYAFEFVFEERTIATGTITAVCCQKDSDGKWSAIQIPDNIVRRLQPMVLPEAEV